MSTRRALDTMLVSATLVALLIAAPMPGGAEDVRDLAWQELIPTTLAEAPVTPQGIDHQGDALDLSQFNPWPDLPMSAILVPDLDGQAVRIAGFVVPLNLTPDNRVDEFLLVPYFGACVHVPPPPPNQIIYVTADDGLDADHLYEAWVVEGTLQVQARRSVLAEAGYTLEAADIRLYRR